MLMQSALSVVYPNQCATCAAEVVRSGGLCGDCWRETPFIGGLCCESCGVPLPGEDDGAPLCDECLTRPRPWSRGRAAVLYRDHGRKIVLQIKHGDRLDLVPIAASWMERASRPLATERTLLVPVPCHWRRLLKRRYNQAAALSSALARRLGCDHAPRALVRVRQTPIQDGKPVSARFADVKDAIVAHRRRGAVLAGRDVLVVDDVLTSGATLGATAEACLAAGAARVDVVVLARTARDA